MEEKGKAFLRIPQYATSFLGTAEKRGLFIFHYEHLSNCWRKASCNTLEQLIPSLSALAAIHAGMETFFLTALVSVRARYSFVSMRTNVQTSADVWGISLCLEAGAIGSSSSSIVHRQAASASEIWSMASERLWPVVIQPGISGTAA